MVLIVFGLPLLAALLGLALDRFVTTRLLGFAATVACLGAAGATVGMLRTEQTLSFLWQAIDTHQVDIVLRFDGIAGWLSLLTLCGGALVLLAISLAIPANLRGFGGLIATAVLLPPVTVLGLTLETTLLLPLAWSLAALISFVVIRSSGTRIQPEHYPTLLLIGFGAVPLLLSIAILPEARGITSSGAIAGWIAAVLLAIGGMPFHHSLDELNETPSAINGLLLSGGLPLLGGASLLQISPTLALSPAWRNGLLLLGVVSFLACAAGAARELRLKRLNIWQMSAQLSLVLASIGFEQPSLTGLLLANTVITTLAASLVVALLEQQAGSDDLQAISNPQPLITWLWIIIVASIVGVPGTWGFWLRSDLFALLQHSPAALAFGLAGTALLGFALLRPLVIFWPSQLRLQLTLSAWPPVIAVLPLAVLGVAPKLLTGQLPSLVPLLLSLVAVGLLVLAPIALQQLASRKLHPEALVADAVGRPIPTALGENLRWLAWIAAPVEAMSAIFALINQLSSLSQRLLRPFEQRYYIAGLTLGLVLVILLIL